MLQAYLGVIIFTPARSVLDFESFAGRGQMLDGRVLEASQVEYEPFGKTPLKRELETVRFSSSAFSYYFCFLFCFYYSILVLLLSFCALPPRTYLRTQWSASAPPARFCAEQASWTPGAPPCPGSRSLATIFPVPGRPVSRGVAPRRGL